MAVKTSPVNRFCSGHSLTNDLFFKYYCYSSVASRALLSSGGSENAFSASHRQASVAKNLTKTGKPALFPVLRTTLFANDNCNDFYQ